MPRRTRKASGDKARKSRLRRALTKMEEAWEALDPQDLSETRLGEMQRVILSLQASLNRLERGGN